jgi:hypothetical protein
LVHNQRTNAADGKVKGEVDDVADVYAVHIAKFAKTLTTILL